MFRIQIVTVQTDRLSVTGDHLIKNTINVIITAITIVPTVQVQKITPFQISDQDQLETSILRRTIITIKCPSSIYRKNHTQNPCRNCHNKNHHLNQTIPLLERNMSQTPRTRLKVTVPNSLFSR